MKNYINIADIVSGTTTFHDGIPLFKAIDAILASQGKVLLSFSEVSPMSSSFMHAVFGALIDKYGFKFFKTHVGICDCRRSLELHLKKYIQAYSQLERV